MSGREKTCFVFPNLKSLSGTRAQTGTDNFTFTHPPAFGIGFEYFKSFTSRYSIGVGLDIEFGDGCFFDFTCSRESFSQFSLFSNGYFHSQFKIFNKAPFVFAGLHVSTFYWDPMQSLGGFTSSPSLGFKFGLGFELLNKRLKLKLFYKVHKQKFEDIVTKSPKRPNRNPSDKWSGDVSGNSIILSLGYGFW